VLAGPDIGFVHIKQPDTRSRVMSLKALNAGKPRHLYRADGKTTID